ncbi:MAG: Hpt domain-containing protein [Dechloromonas sp.]|nr:Hpt domain-containing protein [Dechloromonas sp.]
MSVPHTLEGFEVSAAVERMLDQPTLWWQAVGLFVEHFSAWELTWQGCIGDLAREKKAVHALRSAAANIGAVALSSVAADLESQLLRCLEGSSACVPDQLRIHLRESYRRTFQVAAEAWRSVQRPLEGRAC